MKFLWFAFLFSALAITPLSPAGSQSVEATTSQAIVQRAIRAPSHPVLLAQASSQGALPNFDFGRVIPPANDTILKRDRQHPPAVIGFGVKITPPGNWIPRWEQDVQAFGVRLAPEETSPQPGSWLLRYPLDPCKVARLDMPGTQIPVTYDFVFAASGSNTSFDPPPRKGSFILTLDRDTVPPSITSLSAPDTVYRDQTIEVTVSATDVSEEMGGTLVWDSGLQEFRLEGLSNPSQPGTQSSEQIFTADDTWPTSCDDKVKKTSHTFSYLVPHSAQPGDEITLRAWVKDWTGNETYKDVVLKVVDPCASGARWVGSIGGIHKPSWQHQVKRSAESVRLCEGPMVPSIAHVDFMKGQSFIIPLLNEGSTITHAHADVGGDCRISGGGTLPMARDVGHIQSTLEEVGRNGELRWSQPTYYLSAAPEGEYSHTFACRSASDGGTRTWTNTGAGGWGINIGNDNDPQAGNRKLEGARMAGSYATPDGITATWSLTRQGGAPLFPARGRAQ